MFEVQDGAEVTANAVLDRTKPGFGAWGLDGGEKGGPAAILVKRNGESLQTFTEAYGTTSASKFTNIRLLPGDQVIIESPGGGGFGDPAERDPERVREDVDQGFVSEARAREAYGWKG